MQRNGASFDGDVSHRRTTTRLRARHARAGPPRSRENGERQALARKGLGDGEGSWSMAERTIGLAEMDWLRVVTPGLDTTFAQERAEPDGIGRPDDVDVPDGHARPPNLGKNDVPHALERLAVPCCGDARRSSFQRSRNGSFRKRTAAWMASRRAVQPIQRRARTFGAGRAREARAPALRGRRRTSRARPRPRSRRGSCSGRS